MDFAKIRPRGGTKAQWETANPVLGKREMGIQWESEIGVGKVVIKFGNGVTAWNNLDTAVEVENDLVNKIISSIVTVSDEYPILNDGDSLSTLVGKIKKYIQDLKDKKLDKSARYDGTDSTSTELVPTANALRGVNAKADKNASDITTLNNNLSNVQQSITQLNGYKVSFYGAFDKTLEELYNLSKTNTACYIGFIDWRHSEITISNGTIIWFACNWVVFAISNSGLYILEGSPMAWKKI